MRRPDHGDPARQGVRPGLRVVPRSGRPRARGRALARRRQGRRRKTGLEADRPDQRELAAAGTERRDARRLPGRRRGSPGPGVGGLDRGRIFGRARHHQERRRRGAGGRQRRHEPRREERRVQARRPGRQAGRRHRQGSRCGRALPQRLRPGQAAADAVGRRAHGLRAGPVARAVAGVLRDECHRGRQPESGADGRRRQRARRSVRLEPADDGECGAAVGAGTRHAGLRCHWPGQTESEDRLRARTGTGQRAVRRLARPGRQRGRRPGQG